MKHIELANALENIITDKTSFTERMVIREAAKALRLSVSIDSLPKYDMAKNRIFGYKYIDRKKDGKYLEYHKVKVYLESLGLNIE